MTPTNQTCRTKGGFDRRRFLRLGAIGGLGLSFPALLAAQDRLKPVTTARQAAGSASFGRAKRAVLLFLTGGPSQIDTWDPKPNAPAEVRGELAPIATSVPSVSFSELFPRLATAADKLCVVRSITHNDTVHPSAGYTMLTGAYHPTPNLPTADLLRPSPDDHPHVGSLLAMHRGSPPGLPPFVAIPEIIKDAAVNTFPGQDGGFLGKRHGPLLIEANDERSGFRPPELFLPLDISPGRLDDRKALLARLERPFGERPPVAPVGVFHDLAEQAYSLIGSAAVRRAFDLDAEPEPIRAAYGTHLFGRGCLLARRLLESGVGLVTVYWHYEGPDDSPVWDTHWNNFKHLRERLAAPSDAAVSALITDLDRRGLLDDTLVICMGEFGRTPQINSEAGRDHWPNVQTILLAGAGFPAGHAYGASDAKGGYPARDPVAPPDLTATILHLLGVPLDLELAGPFGRPLKACLGEPIGDLVS